MAKAEGLRLIFKTEDSIQSSVLETFPYYGNTQKICYETQEFSAVCPFSGLPDFAYLRITYIPHQACIELKSFKYYLLSYRDVGIYQEHATNRICDDLYKSLHPAYLEVLTKYNTRGGIDSCCSIEKGNASLSSSIKPLVDQ